MKKKWIGPVSVVLTLIIALVGLGFIVLYLLPKFIGLTTNVIGLGVLLLIVSVILLYLMYRLIKWILTSVSKEA